MNHRNEAKVQMIDPMAHAMHPGFASPKRPDDAKSKTPIHPTHARGKMLEYSARYETDDPPTHANEPTSSHPDPDLYPC